MPSVNQSSEQFIVYREALQRIQMNMEVDEPLMKEWVVRSNKTPT